jgi:hypothetical protein
MEVAFIEILFAPAVHFNRDLLREFAAQVVHMDTSAAVDIRRILSSK